MNKVIRDNAYKRLLKRSAWKENGCLEWNLGVTKKGYGQINWLGKTHLVYKLAWETFRGPYPKTMQIHHTCENKRCWYMGHLRIVTPKENIHSSDTVNRRNTEKTHCPYGHPYNEDNTYVSYYKGNKRRGCRLCRYLDNKRRYLERKLNESSS